MNMGKGAGYVSDFLLKPGALNYFAVSSGAGALNSGLNGVLQTTRDANSLDPNTWQNAGYSAGAALGGTADFALQMGWLRHAVAREGGQEAIKHGGQMYQNLGGGSSGVKTMFGGAVEESIAKTILKEGTHGVYQAELGLGKRLLGGRSFMKNWSFKGGLAMMLAPMALEMVASPVLGLAGKMMDEANQSARMMRSIKYDNRFFDTNRYDASTYQQVGQAMNNYQSKMVSMARVYHA